MSNVDAFDRLVADLESRDALLAPDALVELGRSVAAVLDSSVDMNAALVRQYREIVERLAADDRDDDDEFWQEFHDAGRSKVRDT